MNESLNSDNSETTSKTLRFDRRARLILLIALCFVGFFLADVATPWCFRKPLPAMLCLGVITAQLTVICVWGTLVRGTFWVRLPWTWLLLVISWWGIALGIRIKDPGTDVDDLLNAAIILMFGFVTSFVPLKIAALCFGWQIIQDSGHDRPMDRDSRYTIRDVMIGTLLLAVSMGIGRAMLKGEDISFIGAMQTSIFRDAEGCILIATYGVVSLLVKLPCIWISLGVEREKIPSRIAVWIFYCLFLAIVEIGFFVALFGNPGSESPEVFIGLIVSHQLMGAIMLFVCLTFRGLGYRMQRSRKTQDKVVLDGE
jgi:hypothetical protein